MQQRVDDGIQIQAAVLAVPRDEWLAIQRFAQEHRLLSPTDAGILAWSPDRTPAFHRKNKRPASWNSASVSRPTDTIMKRDNADNHRRPECSLPSIHWSLTSGVFVRFSRSFSQSCAGHVVVDVLVDGAARACRS